ncbi:MAG: DNA primase [Acidimicrobiales bacterium]
MAIPDEDVAQVRASTDIVALIGEYAPLKRVGRRFVGLCPFHSEKSGSFSVNAEEGLYYCFGCQASGDAISFLRAIEGCNFVEAVERLAAKAGIALRDDAGSYDRRARDERHGLYEAMEKAVAFYHDQLLNEAGATRARQYLRSRGLDSVTVRRFKLGWAPEGGSALVRGIKASHAALSATGLTHQGNYGQRDVFRGRVTFPIFQADGKAVAIGGRIVPGIGNGDGPKYRNSSESPIYQKRSTLYGLNWARQAIVQTGEAIVCEGYTDVIGFFRAGLPRAVATCGTALTEDHFKLLARFGRRIVLAFDADGAGENAAARVYEWEKRHELEVAVAVMPPGSDPGDLAGSDPGLLVSAVKDARTYLDFRLGRALDGEDLKNPEGRARAAEAAMVVIAEHPSSLVRDQYVVRAADRTRIEVGRLRELLEEALRRPTPSSEPARARTPRRSSGDEPPLRDEDARPDATAGPGSAKTAAGARKRRPRANPGERAGREALALAIHEPAIMAPRLDEALFVDPLQRRAFVALANASSLHDAIEHADDEVAELLVQLANSDPDTGADQAVVALVRAVAREALGELQAEANEAQLAGDHQRLLEAGPAVAWLKSELELFSEVGAGSRPPKPVVDAADRLVAWLVARKGEAA